MSTPLTSAGDNTAKREFIINSKGEDGYVEVTSSHTLCDVRRLILEDFDVEQLPNIDAGSVDKKESSSSGDKEEGTSDLIPDFAFKVNGIRISTKQESRKNAFDLLNNNVKVELVAMKNNKRDIEENVNGEVSVKRTKLDDGAGGGAVTPWETEARKKGNEKPSDNNNNNNNMDMDDSSTIATGDSISMNGPLQLEGKFDTLEKKDNKKDGEALNDDTAEPLLKNVDEKNAKDGELLNANGEEVVKKGELKKDESSMDLDLEGGGELATVSKDSDVVDGIGIDGKKNKKPDSSEDSDMVDGLVEIGKKPDSLDELNSLDIINEDILEVQDEPPANDPHKESDEAKEKSKHVLSSLGTILKDNPDFCSENRRKEWLEEVNNLLEKSTPQTVFGVLGNTGVGKSSLLNGLLDEAAVLPTSGSRGCTAAVVELVFNSDLVPEETSKNGAADDEVLTEATLTADTPPQQQTHVYRGEVEFITLEDWRKELKTLVDEVSTQEKTIYALVPEESAAPDAAAAWQKIEQVYGKGSMSQFHKASTQIVFNRLAHDIRVQNLLTSTVDGQAYNSVVIEVGEVVPGSDEAKELLKAQMNSRSKSKKKKWAQEFRKRINTYVYRAGNGDQPQTWPLIRKVQLLGPWSVLSSGAVLVDLPGVRDANAARAKVAESYLQNCNQIAIVAPIKRAVDDGTAKELLGEQFKRRLLMDGNYGNVFFICTQTDDIEATETMRDHADVAQSVEGRWERMIELAESISDYEKQLSPLLSAEEELEEQVDDAKQQLKESLADLKEAQEDGNDSEVEDDDLIDNLKAVIDDNKAAFEEAKQALSSWQSNNTPTIDTIQSKCTRLQKKLKAMCAIVRNEYSTSCLQNDFRSGLKELYRKDDDDDDGTQADKELPDFEDMSVFCISANDYLKVMKIKTSRDGPTSCFSNPKDTQIPQLRSFVHETTARFCKSSVKAFVENTNDLLDQMKLVAGDVEDAPGRGGAKLKKLFERTMNDMTAQVNPIAKDFKKVIDNKIQRSLVTSLSTGARKGSQVAMSTVNSWGSKSRRSKAERRPDKNGLYWSTYNAVARREGVYTSASAGAIDLNQELCDPMEKEFSTEWQSVLDSTIKKLLTDAEKTITQLSTSTAQSFAVTLRSNSVDAARIQQMLNTANRSGISAVKASFTAMSALAVNAQRDLSRELLPAVKAKMKSSYHATTNVPRGGGTFDRMKGAMATHSNQAVQSMFDDAMRNLLTGIEALIKSLKLSIERTAEVITKTMSTVFSICWDDNQAEAMIDPEMKKRMRECRDKLLPSLNALVDIQGKACEMLGIEREELELELMEVESFEQTMARKKKEAIDRGDMFDLCDSDTELDIQPKIKVKGEKKSSSYAAAATGGSQDSDVIDLCDSDEDDDDYGKKPAAKPTYSNQPVRGGVKAEGPSTKAKGALEAVIQSADNNGKVNESLFKQALREGYSSVFINGKIADYLKSKGRSYQPTAAAASSVAAMDDNSSASSGLPGDSPSSTGTIAKATADYWKSLDSK